MSRGPFVIFGQRAPLGPPTPLLARRYWSEGPVGPSDTSSSRACASLRRACRRRGLAETRAPCGSPTREEWERASDVNRDPSSFLLGGPSDTSPPRAPALRFGGLVGEGGSRTASPIPAGQERTSHSFRIFQRGGRGGARPLLRGDPARGSRGPRALCGSPTREEELAPPPSPLARDVEGLRCESGALRHFWSEGPAGPSDTSPPRATVLVRGPRWALRHLLLARLRFASAGFVGEGGSLRREPLADPPREKNGRGPPM